MKRLKKGFTIVELVIVIAVIGILAGILIPMFSNLIAKANLASDGVLVRELNNAIAMDAEVNGKHETIHDALKATDEYGFNVQRINAKASQNKILWDSKNDVFCYLKDGVIEYISFSGTESQKLQAGDYRLWTISNNVDPVYSTYLYKYTGNGVIQTDKGLDVGDEYVTSVTYAHTGQAQNVVIRTNGGTFEVNASQDTVYHYGFATEGMIKDVDNNCYYENGTVGRVIYTDGNGKIYFNSHAKVYCYMNASTDSAANLTSTTKAAEAIVYTYVDSGIDQAKGYAATDKEEVVVTNGIVSISTCHNHNEDYDIIKIDNDTYLICKCCGGFSKISTDASGTTTVTSSEGINQENGNNFAAKNDDSLPIVNAVATIDYTKYYSTLAAAVSDSVNGDTIVMLMDVTQSTFIQILNQKIAVDLNGKTISTTSSCTSVFIPYHDNAELTIKDSVGNGKILYSGTASAANQTAIRVYKGKFILENGTIQSVTTATTKAPVYVQSTSTFVMNGGEVSGLTYGVNSSGNVTVNGGLIKSLQTDKSKWSYGVYSNGTLNVNGGEIVSARVGIYESNTAGVVNLDGGTISANEGIMGKGTVNIKSGTINASNIAIYDYNASNKLTVNISGGTINSDNCGVNLISSTSILSMTNGTINAKYIGFSNYGTATISGGEILVENATNKVNTMGILNYNTATISGDVVIVNNNAYTTEPKLDDNGDVVINEKGEEELNRYIPYGVFTNGTSDNKAVLTINGGSISAPNGYALDLYHTDATITDGTLSGVNAIESWTEDNTCTISGGTFNATGGQICYAYKGFFTISGGTFTGGKTTQYEDNQYRFALNCYDSNYTGGKAGFTVMGGTFYQYNPQNDLSEGANTCFTAEGYHTEYNEETGYYTVVAD